MPLAQLVDALLLINFQHAMKQLHAHQLLQLKSHVMAQVVDIQNILSKWLTAAKMTMEQVVDVV